MSLKVLENNDLEDEKERTRSVFEYITSRTDSMQESLKNFFLYLFIFYYTPKINIHQYTIQRLLHYYNIYIIPFTHISILYTIIIIKSYCHLV